MRSCNRYALPLWKKACASAGIVACNSGFVLASSSMLITLTSPRCIALLTLLPNLSLRAVTNFSFSTPGVTSARAGLTSPFITSVASGAFGSSGAPRTFSPPSTGLRLAVG